MGKSKRSYKDDFKPIKKGIKKKDRIFEQVDIYDTQIYSLNEQVKINDNDPIYIFE